MARVKNLLGLRFGKLVVIERYGHTHSKTKRVAWRCKCDCGNETIVAGYSLTSGNTISCGCYLLEQIKKAKKRHNRYIFKKDYAIGFDCNGKAFSFDKCDFDKIKDYCWRIGENNYVKANHKNTIVYLHKLLIPECEIINALFVDHIDKNPTNNRRDNLRYANNSQNMINGNIRINNKTGIIGVQKINNQEKWSAFVSINHKNTRLGTFDTSDEAIKTRLKSEKEFYREFAPQKHLYEKYGIEK
jgi:hypothetical protein